MAPFLLNSTAEFDSLPHKLYVRDIKTVLTPNDSQRVTLIVAGCYVILIFILWHVRFLSWIIYPFKLLTVGFHELSHALAGVLTCATIVSITLDPDEGGSTRMRGGVPAITLPAGYLGSSFIGGTLIACGFDINASKVACLVLGVFFLLTLYWARRSWSSWLTILFMCALIAICWIFAHSLPLRFFVLFLGVMSCFYSVWDIVDDTIARKINTSDASEFAQLCGCCPSKVWGFVWLVISLIFFAAGLLVGIAAFKDDFAQQNAKSENFLGGTPF
ncbi:peptidase M50B-like-domain-containing protein [Mrakia frigida]|uniref:M50 family metallopeptidase n=1 Tax=Mrakia frigida TaxID=29902 RepID=UPI003FCC0944